MIFLPNKYERYAAALRNHLQNLYIKDGKSEELMLKLQKIYEFEVLNFEKEPIPCDVKLLSSRLLITVYSRLLENNICLDFKIKIKDNFLLNFKLYTIVILKLAKHSKYISISNLGGNIIIKCKTEFIINKRYFKSLNSYHFYERKSKTLLVVIKAEKTSKKSVDIKGEWDVINPFSPINLILS